MEQLKWLTLGEKLVEQLLKAHGDFPYNFRFVEPSIPYFPVKKQADRAQKDECADAGFWGDAPAVTAFLVDISNGLGTAKEQLP